MRVARAWFAVVAWAAVVWLLGSDGFSASNTAGVLRPILDFLFPDLSLRDTFRLLVALRKAAHVFEYGILALITLRALWIGSIRSLVASLALTGMLVASLAAADEARQGRSTVRTGSALDVLLDLSGAAIVAVGLVAVQSSRKRPLFSRATDTRGRTG